MPNKTTFNSVIIIFLLLLVRTSACRNVMYKMAGIESIKKFDNNKVEQVEKKFEKLNPEVITRIATKEQFLSYVEGFGDFIKNDLKQPIQIHYYSMDTLASFNANCYAKGSIGGSLDWSFNGKFNEFIPKTSVLIKNNTGLNFVLEKINIREPNTDNTIIFFLSNIMPKQIMEAYEIVINNLKIATGKSTLITINTDNFFAGQKL